MAEAPELLCQEGDGLLEYYQRRAAAADEERQEMLQRVEACGGPTAAEVYRLQGENRKRTCEVRELQKALSDAHTYLFEERERLLALQADNDALRLQEREDRARIKQLLSLTRPLHGCENGARCNTVLPPNSASRAAASGSNSLRRGLPGSGLPTVAQPAGCALPERTLGAAWLPSAQAEALSLRVEALKAQLAEQKQFVAERVSALQQDRAIREREAAAVAAAQAATCDELAEKLHGAEEALRHTTRDYILARQGRDAAEQEAATARAQARAERQAGLAAAAEAALAAAVQLQQQRAEAEADSGAKGLREQLEQRSEELLNLETVHKLLRGQLEARARDAERRAARAAARCRELQQRRAHEMEGWAADVGHLRKRIAGVERRLTQARLRQRLPDDERRDAVLAKHAGLAPGGAQAFEYDASLDGLLQELLCVKDSLLAMAQRHGRAAAHEAAVLGRPPACHQERDDGEGGSEPGE